MNSTTKLTLLTGSVLLLTALVALSIAAVSAAPGPDLVIDKWVGDREHELEVAIAGQELIYEISVRNQGSDAAPNVLVADTLPSQVTYIDATADCTLTPPDELECNLGDLGTWENISFQVKVRVDPDAVADQADGTIVINNEATVDSDVADDDPSNNTVTHSMFVEDSADLLVIKMSKPDTQVRAGEPFSYTIFVENLGPSWARNVSIRDEIVLEPFGDAHIVSVNTDNPGDICNWQETAWGYTILCNRLDPLPVKDAWSQGRWTIQVEMEGDETQDVNNVVNVLTDPELGTADSDLSNNMAEDFIYVTDVADLSVSKYHDGCWHEGETSMFGCFAGGFAQFDIIVENYGPSTAESVVVEDLLPAGVTVVEVSIPEGSGSCTTGIPGDPLAPLTCNLGNLPPGRDGYTQVTINVRFDPDLVDAELPDDYRTLENDVWVYSDIFDPDNGDNRDHVIVDVETLSELAITKWGFPDVAGVGDGVEYEIRIRNFGPSNADMVHFVDLLPSSVDYDDYFFEQGTGTCTYHENLPWPWWEEFRGVHCYVDEIPPNGIVMVHLLGTYNEELWRAGTNEVCNIIPDDDPLSGASDRFGVDDFWSMPGWFADSRVRILWENSPLFDGEAFGWCPDDLYVEADLSIAKTSEPMKIYPGEQKTYHVEVTNNGPTGAPGVLVTDTLPIGVSYEIDNGDCELVGSDPDVLECYLGNMMPGETKGFDVWALVSPDAPPGEITNEACVSMGEGDDPNEENNCDSATNLVLEPVWADLSLHKSVATPPFPPFYAGSNVRFQLQVYNHGPVAAENVVLEDMLPSGVTVLNVNPSQGSCTTGDPGSTPLRCDLGTLDVHASATVLVPLEIDPDYIGTLENDAVVSSDIYDPDNGNNRDYVILNISTWSNVFMKKGCGWEYDVLAGDEIQYDILVRNDGPSTVHNYELWDLLPDEVTFLSYEMLPSGGGECFYTPQLPPMHGGPGQGLHCYLGDIRPGDTHIIYVRARVHPDAPQGTLTNEISDWAADSNVMITSWWDDLYCSNNVINEADLSIRKTSDPYKVYAGEQVRYDIAVTNDGPGIAYNVVVSDTLDPGVEFEISTADCDYSPAVMLGATPPDAPYTLFSVDLGSGTGTFIGDTPEWLAAEIEYDNNTDRLFAAQGFRPWYGDGIGPRLYELDPETGESLGYVELDEPCALPGLEFVDGTLFGACNYDPIEDGGEPYLVTVDPDTGEVNQVDEEPLFYDYTLIHGLAWDESARIMYGLVVNEGNALVTIDLDTGEGNLLCSIWDDDYDDRAFSLRSIEFGADGQLYGGIANDSDLVIIDPNPEKDNGDYCHMHHVGDTGYRVTGLTLMEGSDEAACQLGEISPGETATFSIWARVKPDTLGMIHNRVDVFSDTADPNPDNDWDTEANLVLGKADLKVTKFGKPDGEVLAGEELEYWVLVDNLGPGYAHDVVLYDLISSDGDFELWWPDTYEYTCQVDGCDCEYDECHCEGDAQLTCHPNNPLPVMSPESPGRWLLKVWVEAREEQSINNVAHVVSSDFDPDLSNNEAIAEHDITAVADLWLGKEAWGEVPVDCEGVTDLWEDEVAAGGMLTYTLWIDNGGPSTAENVVVEDWGLSPFLDIINVECEKDGEDPGYDCSCNTSELGQLGDPNRRLVCHLGTMEWGDEDQIRITARIPSDVPEGTLLVNDAKVYGDVLDDENGDNLATNWTTVSRWADLEVLKTQNPEIALPGWDITYSVTVTNLGLSDAEGVFISDTIPVQVLNPQWTCCASDDGVCDVPCEPPVCPEEPCPWPDIDLYAQADIPAGEWVIYTITGTLDWWPCGPFTNTVEIIAPQSLVHEGEDIDPCDENNVAFDVNDPMCHYDPLVLKDFPGPDSTD